MYKQPPFKGAVKLFVDFSGKDTSIVYKKRDLKKRITTNMLKTTVEHFSENLKRSFDPPKGVLGFRGINTKLLYSNLQTNSYLHTTTPGL